MEVCMRRSIVAAVLLGVLLPMNMSLATTYYVSKQAGSSDGNAGTSWGTAWATVSKVNSILVAGDTVYFGSGVWYQSQLEPPISGDANNVTLYSCSTYTTATARMTTISGGTLLNSWTQYSGNVYYASYSDWGIESPPTEKASVCITQGDSQFVYASSVSGVNATGKAFEDISNDRVYVWCFDNANPSTQTMVVGKAERYAVLFEKGQDYVQFFGLILSHGNHSVIHVTDDYAADDPSLYQEYRHCTIRFWAGTDGQNSSGWLSEQISNDSADFNKNILFQACSLYCGTCAETGRTGRVNCFQGYATHRIIADSCVMHSAGDGAKFKDQGSSDQHYGMRVSYCTIYNMDRPEGAISWESHHCSDSVFGCVVYNSPMGIHDMGSYVSGGYLQGKSFICNNTVYDCGVVAMSFCDSDRDADTAGGLGKGNIVKYNIIYGNTLTGDAEAMGFRYTSALSQSLFASQGGAIDSNMYYDNTVNGGSNVWHIYYSGTTYRDWANWKDTGKYGFDTHGTNDVDPEFSDTAAHDFSRPTACQEMNVTYGGRTWYLYGAWQPDEQPYLCGDVTDDCFVDIDDIQFLIAYVFSGGPAPDPMESGDVNCSGDPSVDLDDIVYLINYVFNSGPALCAGC